MASLIYRRLLRVLPLALLAFGITLPAPGQVDRWWLEVVPVGHAVEGSGWTVSTCSSGGSGLRTVSSVENIDGVPSIGMKVYGSGQEVREESPQGKLLYASHREDPRVLDVWIDVKVPCRVVGEAVPQARVFDRDRNKELKFPLLLQPGHWRLRVEAPVLDDDGQPVDEVLRPMLFAAEGAGKILRYARNGAVEWEYPAQMSRDVWQLPNGNVLFCYNDQYDSQRHDNPSGVMEVTPDKRVVFQFKTTGQVWSCQRMADGNTLIGAASQGKLLVVNPRGELVREIKLVSPGGHSCLRNVRQVKGGDFIVAEEGAHAVRRYTADGILVREIKLRFPPYSAVLLENGNILTCGQDSLVEVDPDDKVVRTLHSRDLAPTILVRWMAGMQVLPNGNVLMCNAGGGIPFFEVTRENKVVWSSTGNLVIGHGIQQLDVKGEALK